MQCIGLSQAKMMFTSMATPHNCDASIAFRSEDGSDGRSILGSDTRCLKSQTKHQDQTLNVVHNELPRVTSGRRLVFLVFWNGCLLSSYLLLLFFPSLFDSPFSCTLPRLTLLLSHDATRSNAHLFHNPNH